MPGRATVPSKKLVLVRLSVPGDDQLRPAISPAANAAPDTLRVAASSGLLHGATDPEHDVLTVDLIYAPAPGSFTFNTNTGAFTYTPPINYAGPVTFTYRTFDGGLYSGPVTVTINVLLASASTQRRVR